MQLIRAFGILLVVILGWTTASPRVNAQPAAQERLSLTGGVSQAAAAFGISKAVTDLPPEPLMADSGTIRGRDSIRTIKNPPVRGENRRGQPDEWLDFAVHSSMPDRNMPATLLTFDGNSSTDNAAAYGFRPLPPDTVGDVGPNHYVQQTNLLVRIFNKAGAPLTAPFKLSTLFTSGGICTTNNNGDPIVMYDHLADRWILSQFGFSGSGTTPPYHECIAISRTPDPTGSYFLYDFVTPGSEFPDYPHFGVWPDAYYMTVNQFLLGGPFDGTGAYAFDRAKMLAGDPTATFIYFNLNLASHPEGIGGALPSDLDGLRPPAAGTPNVFSYFLATEFGDALDGLRLFDFHADFVTPASSTFAERAESPVAVAAFNPLTGGQRVPQPGTGATLDVITDRLMNRLQYRNTGSAQTLVVTHSVDADASAAFRAGVRYYELRRTGATYGVNEQATFSPDTVHRWMGSAATDHTGNLAVGYSAGNSAVFPGIRYAGRLSTDAPGGLFQGESTLVAGSGVQTHGSSRWGDYSALTVDPVDDCTFWYTQEYYTAAGQAASAAGWQTRIGSFKYPTCTPAVRGTLNVSVTNCSTSADIANASVSVDLSLYGVTNASGDVSASVIPGTYTVSATSPLGSASSSATVAGGGTATVNLCIGGGQPDLVVTQVIAPGKAAPGQIITVKDFILNSGLAAAAASNTNLYLSTDTTLSGGDPLLSFRAVPPLAAGASNSGATLVAINPATVPGTYFVIAKADGGSSVSESNETNNTRTKKILIGPDLQVKLLSAPASAPSGTTISISDTTKNIGGGPAAGSVTRFFLSLNTTVDGGDINLGSRVVPVLAAGASSAAVTSVLIPAGTAPGAWRIIAVADANATVTEIKETNNTKVFSITITP